MTGQKPLFLVPEVPEDDETMSRTSPYRVACERRESHQEAMRKPCFRFDRAVVGLLEGWEGYADAYEDANSDDILDSRFRQPWIAVGEALLNLVVLVDELDSRALERRIRCVLSRSEYQDRFSDWLADATPKAEPQQKKENKQEQQQTSVVFAYTRAQAIADGVLVDVTATAKEAGFRVPVALTQSLWSDIYAIPERLRGVADSAGRLWDVLFVGHCAMKQQDASASSCRYRLEMPVGEESAYHVKAVCGPGDDGEPVLTLMRPEED